MKMWLKRLIVLLCAFSIGFSQKYEQTYEYYNRPISSYKDYQVAGITEFPFSVAVFHAVMKVCCGILVSEHHVLMASTCIGDKPSETEGIKKHPIQLQMVGGVLDVMAAHNSQWRSISTVWPLEDKPYSSLPEDFWILESEKPFYQNWRLKIANISQEEMKSTTSIHYTNCTVVAWREYVSNLDYLCAEANDSLDTTQHLDEYSDHTEFQRKTYVFTVTPDECGGPNTHRNTICVRPWNNTLAIELNADGKDSAVLVCNNNVTGTYQHSHVSQGPQNTTIWVFTELAPFYEKIKTIIDMRIAQLEPTDPAYVKFSQASTQHHPWWSSLCYISSIIWFS